MGLAVMRICAAEGRNPKVVFKWRATRRSDVLHCRFICQRPGTRRTSLSYVNPASRTAVLTECAPQRYVSRPLSGVQHEPIPAALRTLEEHLFLGLPAQGELRI